MIVPSHNTRALTLRCLASVLSQRDEVLEVVVVDNGSRDGSADAVAEAFSSVRLLAFGKALGFAGAANAGASAARGEILLFLNSDAELLPGALAALRAVFAGRPRLAAAGARLLSEQGAPEWSGGRFPTLAWMLALGSGLPAALASLPVYRRLALRRRERPHEGAGGAAEIAAVDWVSGAALAVRAAEFRRGGGFATGYRFYAQDVELCTVLREREREVAIVDAFRVRHALGASVSQMPGARGARVDFSRLLPDLVRWGERRRGEAWGRTAARLLVLGLALRVAARRLRFPFSDAARRPAFRAETLRYARARRELVRSIARS